LKGRRPLHLCASDNGDCHTDVPVILLLRRTEILNGKTYLLENRLGRSAFSKA
jgi:hypothetical protein